MNQKKGGLFFVKTITTKEEKWTGFGNYGRNYVTVTKPIIAFFNPEDKSQHHIKDQEKFCNVPLLFLKTRRKIMTQKGHSHIDHTDPWEGCSLEYLDYAYTRPGPPNSWDTSQHVSADVYYEHHFLLGKEIVAVLIPADKSFGEYFHQATD